MIDLTELTGEIKTSDREHFLETLTKILDRHGDPFKLPDAFAEWLSSNYGTVDQYYCHPVGFGPLALTCHYMFKKEMLIIEFRDPYGQRLMELRLHA